MKTIDELGISHAPWDCHKQFVTANDDGSVVAATNMRDARLIAAAPELYECLRDAVEDMEEINCDPDGCSSCLLRDDCKIQKYRYVLAKASGEEVAK